MNLPHLREQFHREREWPFSHENKWMAVQCTPKYNPVGFYLFHNFFLKIYFLE
jgi:hypothetical protein